MKIIKLITLLILAALVMIFPDTGRLALLGGEDILAVAIATYALGDYMKEEMVDDTDCWDIDN